MSTAAAIIAGVIWGGACGFGKYLLLWRPLFDAAERDEVASQSRVGRNSTLSLLLDLPILFLPYLLRSVLPFPLAPCLIATAVALSVCGRWPLLYRVHEQRKAEEAAEKAAAEKAAADDLAEDDEAGF
ncbi:MAG: hypothetical protein IJH45_01340 [Firmicutes bacterium]|nr:hypothetical protein [Bacillota bacterium]